MQDQTNPEPEFTVQEGQIQEPVADATAPGAEIQPEAAAEDFITYKHKDREVPLPLQAAEQIAQAIGWKGGAQALVNQLQIAQDAKEFYDGGRRYYQSVQQVPAQPANGYPQQPQTYQGQRHQQYQAPAQPQQSANGEPDPIEVLYEIRKGQQAFQEYIENQRLERQQQEQQALARTERECQVEHSRFAKDLMARGTPPEKIPDMWTLLREADEIGLLAAGLPPSQVYERIYRMNYADDMVNYGVQAQMNRLRDPRAQVTVPSSRGQAPPVQQGNPLDSMSIKDLLPEGRY